MEPNKPIWKHESVFMTSICFIAFCLGRYRAIINRTFKIVLIVGGIYTLMTLLGLSVEIIRKGEVLLRIF
jgi:hypothetical protein